MSWSDDHKRETSVLLPDDVDSLHENNGATESRYVSIDLLHLAEDGEDGIAVFDSSGTYLFVNRATEHLLQRPRTSILGRSVKDVYPELVSSSKPLAEFISHASQSRTPDTFDAHSPALGTWLQVRLIPCSAHKTISGDERGVTVYFRDVTAREEATAEVSRLYAETVQFAWEQAELVRKQRAFLKDVLSAVTEGVLCLCDRKEELPVAELDMIDAVPLSAATTLRTLRRVAARVAAYCELPEDRVSDLLTATSEAAMNVVTHAGGRGEGRVICDAVRGCVQVWVTDTGPGIPLEQLHRAVLERGFTTAGTLGHGFWLMLKTADRVYLHTDEGGTTVVLEEGRSSPEPEWAKRGGATVDPGEPSLLFC